MTVIIVSNSHKTSTVTRSKRCKILWIFSLQQIYHQLKFQNTDKEYSNNKMSNCSFIVHDKNDLWEPCWREKISKNDRCSFPFSINHSVQYLNCQCSYHIVFHGGGGGEWTLPPVSIWKRNLCRSGSGFELISTLLLWWLQKAIEEFSLLPHGSDSKESACNAEDLGLIPG